MNQSTIGNEEKQLKCSDVFEAAQRGKRLNEAVEHFDCSLQSVLASKIVPAAISGEADLEGSLYKFYVPADVDRDEFLKRCHERASQREMLIIDNPKDDSYLVYAEELLPKELRQHVLFKDYPPQENEPE